MGDQIERDKLLDSLPKNDTVLSLDVRRIVVEAPAVDAAPVVHGRWVEYPVAHYFKCSKCKYIVPYKKAVRINEKQAYNYCPSCGAKMDGEGDAE